MITTSLITSDADFDVVKRIRYQVFVLEQEVEPELEFDEYEETSNHFLAYLHGEPVGTARWRQTHQGIKLERFAVLASARKQGVGYQLVESVLEHITKTTPKPYVYLHAQVTAVHLYEKFGLKKSGNMFEECGIKHYKMERWIK